MLRKAVIPGKADPRLEEKIPLLSAPYQTGSENTKAS